MLCSDCCGIFPSMAVRQQDAFLDSLDVIHVVVVGGSQVRHSLSSRGDTDCDSHRQTHKSFIIFNVFISEYMQFAISFMSFSASTKDRCLDHDGVRRRVQLVHTAILSPPFLRTSTSLDNERRTNGVGWTLWSFECQFPHALVCFRSIRHLPES